MSLEHVGSGIDPDYTGNPYPFMEKKLDQGKGVVLSFDHAVQTSLNHLCPRGVRNQSDKHKVLSHARALQDRVLSDFNLKGDRILAAILPISTLSQLTHGLPSAEFLWKEKGIVPCAQLISQYDRTPNIELPKLKGLAQQFELCVKYGVFALQIKAQIFTPSIEHVDKLFARMEKISDEMGAFGIIPIFSPIISHTAIKKAEIEFLLRQSLENTLDQLGDRKIILNLPLPEEHGFYDGLIGHPNVLSVWANSNELDLSSACNLLRQNAFLFGAFSGSLLNSIIEHNDNASVRLNQNIDAIYRASLYGTEPIG